MRDLMQGFTKQMDAICQLLIEKVLITQEELYAKLKQVQNEYQQKGKGIVG